MSYMSGVGAPARKLELRWPHSDGRATPELIFILVGTLARALNLGPGFVSPPDE